MFQQKKDASKLWHSNLSDQMIGESFEFKRLSQVVKSISDQNVVILLEGETGTGKGLFASAIHYNSLRKDKSIVIVNCAFLTDENFEKEIFGTEGKVDLAQGGTLFLDEIANLSLRLQGKLLHLFDRNLIKRDSRIIVSTNEPLKKKIKRGQFRKDLYHRLNEFSVSLPPLRNRHGDIPLLVDYFLKKFTSQSNRQVEVHKATLEFFDKYDWPGNIRELKNTLKSAMILCNGVIYPEHLPKEVWRGGLKGAVIKKIGKNLGQRSDLSLKIISKEILEEIENKVIEEALRRTNGRKGDAARLLSVDVKTLYNKLKNENRELISDLE